MTPPWTVEVLGVAVPDTVVWSVVVTAGLGLLAALVGARLRVAGAGALQVAVELFVAWVEGTIAEVVEEDPAPYAPLIGGLMLFVAASNALSIVPRVRPPTAELAVPVALALVVFVAVPFFGVRRRGLRGYLRTYLEPSPLLLPLNVIGELSRTLALCVRLFGNAMSGQMIGAIVLLVAGLLVPVPLLLLGLLGGLIQAYIFGILAAVYIAAAVQVEREPPAPAPPQAAPPPLPPGPGGPPP